MKSFGRLLAVSRRFYLWVFAIVVMVVLADCAFICKDKDVYLTKSGVTQMVQTTLAEENGVSLVENHYLTLENIAAERGNGFELVMVMLGVMSLLFAREIAFTDGRTQEFRHTWPVKNWVRELYDYVAMLLVIVLGFVLETLILLLMQIRYNHLVINVSAEQGITSKVTDAMTASNHYFLLGMACYLIAIVTSYTWISLGMSLAKNSIVGAILSVVVKGLLPAIWMYLRIVYEIVMYWTNGVPSAQPGYNNELVDAVESLGYCLLTNGYFLFEMDVKTGNIDSIGSIGNVFTVYHWMIVQAAVCMVLIICLVISARKKDLSKGKLLYFPLLRYPLGVMSGFGVFSFCCEWLCWWDYNFEVVLSLVLSLSAAVATILLCRPASKSKSVRLEVK